MKIIISGWTSNSKDYLMHNDGMKEIILETIVYSKNCVEVGKRFISRHVTYLKVDDIEKIKKSIIMSHISQLIDTIGFDKIEEIEIF